MSQSNVGHAGSAPVFAALGSVTRLELLSRLGDGREHSITELTDGLDVTRQAITKHLQVMEEAGIVDSMRVGRESRFKIQPRQISEARDYLSRISDQWEQAIDRLRTIVEQ